MIRIPTSAWLLLALPLPALAQQDDSEYARGLAQRGWFDMAQTICDRIEKNASGKLDQQGAVFFIRAEIEIAKSHQARDIEEAKGFIDTAMKFLNNLINNSKFAGHTLMLDARTSYGQLLARKGKMISSAIEAEQSPEKVSDLTKEGQKVYEEAGKYYQTVIDDLKKASNEKPTDDVLWNLHSARLDYATMLLDHCKLPGLPSGTAPKLLAEGVKSAGEILWEVGPGVLATRANMVIGQCHIEQGDFKSAEKMLKEASFGFRDMMIKERVKPTEWEAGLMYEAFAALAHMYNRAGKPGDAKSLVDQLLKDGKNLTKEWEGVLKLHKAEAMYLMKDAAGAMALATEVAKANPQLGGMVNKKTAEWAGKGGSAGVKVNADQMWTAAEGYMGKDQYREALVSLRRCIEAIAGDDERTKFLPKALFNMGQCLEGLQRNYEAASLYEQLFTVFPKHELAGPACSQAIFCYTQEYLASGDEADKTKKKDLMSRLVRDYPADAVDAAYFVAKDVEDSGDRLAAAEKYLQVSEKAKAYEKALVSAGVCFQLDALKKYKEGKKDDAAKAAARTQLLRAEETFKKFLARVANPALTPTEQQLLTLRAQLIAFSYEQLANIYIHELVGRAEESLKMLDQWSKSLAPDDDRLAKCWSLQIQAHIALNRRAEAIKVLDAMFDRFPDGVTIARPAKQLADQIDDATEELRKAKGDPEEIKENLRRTSRYYMKWFNEGVLRGMSFTTPTAVEVGNRLYFAAKEINGLGNEVVSFADLKGKKVLERKYFTDAAFVLSNLTGNPIFKLAPKDQIEMVKRLARCYSFQAGDPSEWTQAKDKYDEILKSFKLFNAKGEVEGAVLVANPGLLDVYVELGNVYLEIARSGKDHTYQFDNASDVFNNVLRFTASGTELWWSAKYSGIQILYERGKAEDIKLAQIALGNIESNYPDFDGGKYGMKERFAELKAKVDRLQPQK